MRKVIVVALVALPAVALAQHFKPAPRPAPYRPAPSRPYSPPRYNPPPRPSQPYRAPQPPPTYFRRQQPPPPRPYYPPAPPVIVVPGGGGGALGVPGPAAPAVPVNWSAVGYFVGGLAVFALIGFGIYILIRHQEEKQEEEEESIEEATVAAGLDHPVFKQNTFTCSECRGVFPVVLTYQEAKDEAQVLFEGSVDENEILCDGCFKKYQDDARRG